MDQSGSRVSDLNLVEKDDDLDHYTPQELHIEPHVQEVTYRYQSQTYAGEEFLSYQLQAEAISKWSLKSHVYSLFHRFKDNFIDLMRVYTSPSTLIGGDPRKNDTVDMKEAQGNKAYTLEVLTKEAQPVTITDCHAGNPCELEIDLTAKSSSPIIEGMYGQDWKEHAET
ncbi:hypothetical protein Tco_1429242 [Tanacetum coccineum]